MFVRVQVPLRVLMIKDQVFKPGFFVSEKIVKLALKGLEETKKHRREADGSSFGN